MGNQPFLRFDLTWFNLMCSVNIMNIITCTELKFNNLYCYYYCCSCLSAWSSCWLDIPRSPGLSEQSCSSELISLLAPSLQWFQSCLGDRTNFLIPYQACLLFLLWEYFHILYYCFIIAVVIIITVLLWVGKAVIPGMVCFQNPHVT